MLRAIFPVLLTLVLTACVTLPPRGENDKILSVLTGRWQSSQMMPPGYEIFVDPAHPVIRISYLPVKGSPNVPNQTDYKLIGNDPETMTSYLFTRSDEYNAKGDYHYAVRALTYMSPERLGRSEHLAYYRFSLCGTSLMNQKTWDHFDRQKLWDIFGPNGSCRSKKIPMSWSRENFFRYPPTDR